MYEVVWVVGVFYVIVLWVFNGYINVVFVIV